MNTEQERLKKFSKLKAFKIVNTKNKQEIKDNIDVQTNNEFSEIELTNLRQRIYTLDQEKSQLQQQIQIQKENFLNQTLKVKELQQIQNDRIQNLRDKIQNFSKEKSANISKNDENKDETNNIKQLEELRFQNLNKQKIIGDQFEKIQILEKTISKLQVQINLNNDNSIKNQLDMNRQQFEKYFQQQQQQNQLKIIFEEERRSQQIKIEHLEQKVMDQENINIQFKQIQRINSDYQQKINELQAKLQETEQKKKIQEQEIQILNKYKKEYEQGQIELEEIEHKYDKVLQQKLNQSQLIEQNKSQLKFKKKLQEENLSQQAEIISLKTQVQEQNDLLLDYQNQIKQFDTNISQYQNRLKKLSDNLEEVCSEKNFFKQENKYLQTRISNKLSNLNLNGIQNDQSFDSLDSNIKEQINESCLKSRKILLNNQPKENTLNRHMRQNYQILSNNNLQ